MRLVIDLQGAQGSSRHRGIGRYSLSLAQALARNRGQHEVFVALNGLFPESIEPIRAALDGLVPPENIIVWQSPGPVHAADPANEARRYAAELVRESVLASVSPDYVLVTSVFEGLGDDIVTSIGQLTSAVPTAAVLYDLIPLIHREKYLNNAVLEAWYENKLGHFRNANLLLAISESSRREAVTYLGIADENTFNISTAAEDHFTPAPVDDETRDRLRRKYGLLRPFVMYTGGIDHRKNIEGLIEAFAKLPGVIRRGHQLAIVCSVPDHDRERLRKIASDAGLANDDVILTGFIPEDDLLACYRACKLFIFPSWHEGFGLPVLEAMKCGRAVIAGNRSSLPEVVGLESALFDPFDVGAISKAMAKVLGDDELREQLERHGLKQATKFGWDETANHSWYALEKSLERLKRQSNPVAKPARRPRLAFVSPLPPEASGISDYSAELLPELARHYRVEVIVAQPVVGDPAVLGNFPVRDVDWFRRHAREFDRILYHFGNSHFHSHMFDLLHDHPGVVVLHDFFLSGSIARSDVTGENPGGFARALLDAHGWPAVVERFKAKDTSGVVWTYPCNQQVLQDALGVIVHADYSRQLAEKWYGEGVARDWRLIPHLRRPIPGPDQNKARNALGLPDADLVVCSFGMLGPTKMNDRLLTAWLESPLAQDSRCHLVFVGQKDGTDYGAEFDRTIRMAKAAGRIEITGWADMPSFRNWLTVADFAVQLRTYSRGETSGTVLDCMNAGLATIVNANGSMGELPKDGVLLLDDDFTDADLIGALTALWSNKEKRRLLGERAKAYISNFHQPSRCASAYAEAIEYYYTKAATGEYGLARALIEGGAGLSSTDWADISASVARNLSPSPHFKRLLIDVSELVHSPGRESEYAHTTASILECLLRDPPKGWIVEPVYAQWDKPGYRYARNFTCDFLEVPQGWCEDSLVEPSTGDVFIGLAPVQLLMPHQQDFLQGWRQQGVGIWFVVHDLLPLMLPQFFPSEIQTNCHNWLGATARFDGVICLSQIVSDEYIDWLDLGGPKRELPLAIDWIMPGADVGREVPGLPSVDPQFLSLIETAPFFLVAGAIEPRLGLSQVLEAFDQLWASGVAVNLVIIGEQGWMMDEFMQRLHEHPKFGNALLWIEKIGPEGFGTLLDSCHGLIVASEGNRYSLPLLKALRGETPVLARDIPALREAGGSAVTYFPDHSDPDVIVKSVTGLLKNRNRNGQSFGNRSWPTWSQSANMLLDRVLKRKEPSHSWRPENSTLRLWGSDVRLGSNIGSRRGTHMRTQGQDGYLVFGPYLPVEAGSYTLRASGEAIRLTGDEYIDVVSGAGHDRHAQCGLRIEGQKWQVEQFISLGKPVKDVEIRLWVEADTDISLASIELEPVISTSPP